MGAEADFLHFMLAVSLVFPGWESSVPDWLSLSVAERCFFIQFAAMRSVSLRLQSLNQKTLTDYHGCPTTESFSRIRFLIYVLIFVWFWLYLGRTNGILDGLFFWFCLHIKWFVWFGRLVFYIIWYIRECFFEHEICRRPTDQSEVIERIKRILQVRGTCFL